MKKLLLLTALLLTFATQAQDKEYITKLNNLDKASAQSVADEYVLTSTNKWEPMYVKDNEKSFTVYYVNSAVNIDRKKMLVSEMRECESGECCSVRFVKNNGVYKFDYILMEYEELFPIWKKYFNKDAVSTTLPNDLKSQEYKDGYLIYKFKPEQGPYWSIDKF